MTVSVMCEQRCRDHEPLVARASEDSLLARGIDACPLHVTLKVMLAKYVVNNFPERIACDCHYRVPTSCDS